MTTQPSAQKRKQGHGLNECCLHSSALARPFWPFVATLTALSFAFCLAQVPLFAKAADAPDGGSSTSPSNATATPNATPNSESGSKPGKRTQINFEDQLVEGQAQKPELFYLLQQRSANFKRLIHLREDFLPEMRKTADEIQRKGTVK